MHLPKKRSGRLKAVMDALRNQGASGKIPSDVLGSYTGNAMDGDRPIQDADDL